jgi:hypothetical protein
MMEENLKLLGIIEILFYDVSVLKLLLDFADGNSMN